jgi:CubicO group peptidase (beta-lactamase class C family)
MRYALAFCLALLASQACAAGDTTSPADKLMGLWGSERAFGPAAAGRLTLDGRGTTWQVEIAGVKADVQHADGKVAFTLPGEQGGFSGTMSPDGKHITGFWIQPPGVTLSSAYATPLDLHETGPGLWETDVHPLTDSVSLYLLVSRAADGSLKAFIRNPEFNFGMRRGYALSLTGTQLTLDDTQRKHDQLRGSYDPEQDSLAITLQGIGTFDFTRRDPDHALGFYPATPAVVQYSYRPPVQEDDGWLTGTLQEAGLKPKPLTALIQQVLDTKTDWYTTPYIQSILVARHGKLALEEYFYGFDRERTHDTRSSAKTLTGTLVGIALDHGAKFGLDSPVYPLFTQYQGYANPDPRKQKITVQDLLTMDSGYACDDNDDDSPGNEDTMQGQSKQPDWYKYTLDLPMQDEPGDKQAVYCTAGINLLGGIIRNTTGMPLMDFFQQYYAGPLDIRDYHMNLMPTGDAYMGGGIYLRPRDMLKLGQLYLDGGIWNGKRVLSAAWVKRSTTQYSFFPASDYAPGHGYGYTWHLFRTTVGDHSYDEYMAQGNGGQLVMVVPELDLAAVITAGNYSNFPTWRKFFEELLPQYIITAARD